MSCSSQYSSSSGGRGGPRVVVVLDFGTTFSGFAYAHTAETNTIYKFYDWPCVGKVGAKPYCKTQTSLYYETIIAEHATQDVGHSRIAPAAFKLKSWGWSALVDYTESDWSASTPSDGGRNNSNRSCPPTIASRMKCLSVMDSEGCRPWEANRHNTRGKGFIDTKFKLYLADASDRSNIPAGLSVEIIIADYLRCISGFILSELQLRYGEHLGMDDVQF